MTDFIISGGRALLGQQMREASLEVAGGKISAVDGSPAHGAREIDAGGLLVLPGIVDLHGDAFERQMMPRPGVDFPIDVALIDSNQQAIANGITTVFHATTWSWEPGLRSGDNAKLLLESIEALRPQLAADTRFHLRHETYNLDAESEICEMLAEGRIDLFAFNDHMDSTVANLARPRKRSVMVQRTGLADREFDELVERIAARADDVPASIARLATAARDAGIRMTTTRPRCGRRFVRRASASPNSRSTNRPPAKRPEPATSSCSARRTWCVAAAIPAGPRPAT